MPHYTTQAALDYSIADLAKLFTKSFAGYFVPVNLNATTLANLMRRDRQCAQAQQESEQQSEWIVNRHFPGRVMLQEIHHLESRCKRLAKILSALCGAPEHCSCGCPVKEASFTLLGQVCKALAEHSLRMREGGWESHAARVGVPLVQPVVVAGEPAELPAVPVATFHWSTVALA